MGCTYTCNRKNLQNHLASCTYSGISIEQDLRERNLTKQAVIQECEEERERRKMHISNGSGYWSEISEKSQISESQISEKSQYTERSQISAQSPYSDRSSRISTMSGRNEVIINSLFFVQFLVLFLFSIDFWMD